MANLRHHDSDSRHRESLLRELSEPVAEALANDDITEVMRNGDGRLWIESQELGLVPLEETMGDPQAEALLSTVAGLVNRVVTNQYPILEAELPLDRSRIEGVLPPVVSSPVFAIRKRAVAIHTLDEYVEDGSLTQDQAHALAEAIDARKNILISGGPGSGKTTLANAILREMEWLAPRAERILILEDTYELQCSSPNHVTLHTTENVSLRDLVRAAIRLRPDRIIIGEVRGAEALDLLKAWNTGNPGGCATAHANSAGEALSRLDQLAQEAGVPSQAHLIASTVHLVVHMERNGSSRRVRQLVSVRGVSPSGDFQVEPIAESPTAKEIDL